MFPTQPVRTSSPQAYSAHTASAHTTSVRMTPPRTTSSLLAPPRVPSPRIPSPHASASAPTLREVRPTLWRVLRSDGSMAGYIEHAAERYEARRMIGTTRRIVGIGDFASIDDALSCFQ